jgi:hypothetical protein
MRYVELHKFPDDRFVSGGFSHFVWGVFTNTQLPTFPEAFGLAVPLADGAESPATFARFNPTTGTYADRLPDDAVEGLPPFFAAAWTGGDWVFV